MKNSSVLLNREEIFTVISKNTGVASDSIMLESTLQQLCDRNIYKIGLILYDLHELTNKNITYNEEESLHMFKTVQDIVDYFENN